MACYGDSFMSSMVNIFQIEECRILRCGAVCLLLRTDVSEERIFSIIRVERISEPGPALSVEPLVAANVHTSQNASTLMMEVTFFSEKSVLTRAITTASHPKRRHSSTAVPIAPLNIYTPVQQDILDKTVMTLHKPVDIWENK
jgi:hypothetical protein